MIAELKLTFEIIPQNLLNSIQGLFPLNGTSMAQVIANTIYSPKPNLHNSFLHGFQAADSTLLFQITGHELMIHIELPPSNNLYLSLKRKVNSYHDILITFFKNNGVDINTIKQEVMISSEDSYILIGKIPNRNVEFRKELDNNKLRIIFIPIGLLLVNLIGKKLGWISNIETVVVSSCSLVVALIIWYITEYLTFKNDNQFKFVPLA